MAGCRVEHIGIIVDDLDASLRLFEDLFGLRAGKVQEMDEVGLRVARLDAENIHIELIQYTSAAESLGRRTMGSVRGYNHISVEVKDMSSALKEWSSKGVRVMEGFPRPGSHGRVAFFDPETTDGLLLEVCET
jgi:methylmalonyl-CoA/ethylmalonyl-CoA epimerase